MIHSVITIILSCSLLFALGAMQARASDIQAGEYMTGDAFIEVHPEQGPKQERFKAMVRAKAASRSESLRPVTVSVIYPAKQVSDYWVRSMESFKKRLNEHGVKAEVHEYFMKPTAHLKEQAQRLRRALMDDPDYLIFTLDAKRHQRMIEKLLLEGKPRVILQNITTPLTRWEGMQPFLYDGFDHIEGSRMLAREAVKKTGGTGKFAAILPQPGYLSTMRGDYFINEINKISQMTPVAVYHTDIDKNEARIAAESILKNHPDIKYIYGSTTDIALGAAEAVAGAGLTGKVLVSGWGGGSAELEAIRNGRLDFTVMRINDDNGAAMADAIVLDQQGRGDEVPVVFSGDFAIVDADISDNALRELKNRAFRYSGQDKD